MKRKSLFFLVSFLTLCSVSCSSSESNDSRTYEEYKDFFIENVEDIYSQKEEKYYVEVFFETCPHCIKAKPHAFDYVDKYKNKEKEIKYYFFNIQSGSTFLGKDNRAKFKEKPKNYNKELLIAKNVEDKVGSVGETYFFGVPVLYEIINNKLNNEIIGDDNIINFIK